MSDNYKVLQLEKKIKKIDGVNKVFSISDVVGVNIPKEIISLPNNVVNKEITKPQIKQENVKNNQSKKLLVNKTEDQKISRTTIKTSENTQKVIEKESKIESHYICILINILLLFVLIIQKIKTNFVESV